MVTGRRSSGQAGRPAAPAGETATGRAREVAASVADPELPMLTLADLGVLRDVREEPGGGVTVTITPTYTGCPAVEAMRDDLRARLLREGFTGVEVRVVLDPPWTSDWISASGRRKLEAAGVAPPGPAPRRAPGPVPLTLGPRPPGRGVRCPRCGSGDTAELSPFGATACKALWRCRACAEPFERFKEI
ncbi:1,2-phenylacetyl-CoA epoxidase subunit PaaD [Nonomuraea pusilla]|uniref:Ring-1,2-phenylacetyl-CoA epoxidase subunit PaaD n=1 Tax=Nonomuraea pusilla TaxID=46177 RepID=A0A1H7UM13_9ACTN|nr:ring-1,2-phenylacetyl-CoA epoxidase subunit PaaD [Nonomuraea pusilla]